MGVKQIRDVLPPSTRAALNYRCSKDKNSSQTINKSALVKTLLSKTIVVLLFTVTIHEHSIENKVIDLAVNDSSAFKNVSVMLKRVSHNDNITLLNQGKI